MSLSPRKRRAVLALMECGSVARAAEQVGVSRQALHRWIKEPEFAQALREASGARFVEASRRLDALLMQAIDELEKLLHSESEQQRRLTADSVISHAIRIRELTEIESRITALEKINGVIR